MQTIKTGKTPTARGSMLCTFILITCFISVAAAFFFLGYVIGIKKSLKAFVKTMIEQNQGCSVDVEEGIEDFLSGFERKEK